MDDINFDELDQAVNSALKQSAPKGAPQTDVPVVEPVTAPSDDTPAQVAQPIVVPKRRGQFMDMVHPSSDMIKPTTPRPNRQAMTIEPLSPEIVETPEEAPEQHDVPQVAVGEGSIAPIESQEIPAKSEIDMPAPKPEWPDPLDVMEQTKQERDDSLEEANIDEPEATVSDVAEHDDSEEVSDETAQGESGTSPFLTGTSPEKRPLGAFAEVPTSSEAGSSEEIDSPTPESDKDVEVSEQPHQDFEPEPLPAVPVPQELAPEVISVESDEPMHHPDEGTSPGEAGPMTTSIPQQYKNSDVPPEDQADHPVFDTRDYHQPLTPPAKQGHAGAIVTIVLILLALLGVGAWYAIAVLKLI